MLEDILACNDGVMLRAYFAQLQNRQQVATTGRSCGNGWFIHTGRDEVLTMPEWSEFERHLSQVHVVEEAARMETMLAAFRYFTDRVLSERWHLPFFYYLCDELKKRALRQKAPDSLECLENAADVLMHAFRCCSRHRDWPAPIPLANCLCRLYHKMNRLILCKPLLQAFASKRDLLYSASDDLTAGDRLTFLYYSAMCKILVFNQLPESLLDFEYVFSHAPTVKCLKQKRQVLHWLIPLKLALSGQVPRGELLNKYRVSAVVRELLQHANNGQIIKFERSLDAFSVDLLRSRTYIIWSMARTMVVRNMYRRVITSTQKEELADNKLSITMLAGLAKASIADRDETEDSDDGYCEEQCSMDLCQLISRGLLKAYLSESHAKLVCSKDNLFPPVCQFDTAA